MPPAKLPESESKRHIRAVEEDLLRSVQRLQIDARAGCKRLKVSFAIEPSPLRERFQRERARHRAGVDIDVAHQFRHAPRQRALPRAHRPIYGDNQFFHFEM